MNHNLVVFLEGAPAPGAGSLFQAMLPMLIIMGVMYFLMIRPQKKREKELREQLDRMQVGDEVITIGGIVGRVFNIQNDEVTIATSVQNTLMTFKKSAISQIVSPHNSPKVNKEENTTKEKEDEKKSSFLDKIKNKEDVE